MISGIGLKNIIKKILECRLTLPSPFWDPLNMISPIQVFVTLFGPKASVTLLGNIDYRCAFL